MAKKRTASTFGSPVKAQESDVKSSKKTLSAASNPNNSKLSEVKKKYKFAPINNLSDQQGAQKSVLRSISLSQIRNTKARDDSLKESSDQIKCAKSHPKKEVAPHSKPQSKNQSEAFSEGPSEEVIWQYSPAKVARDFSERDTAYRSSSEESLQQVFKESSTPIVHNKFKSILSFSHIKASDEAEDHQDKDSKRASRRQNSTARNTCTNIGFRTSTRDIEDIINDLEGGFDVRPTPKPVDIPSSPIKMISQPNENDTVHDTNDNYHRWHASSDSLDADDSLIEILTQKFSERKPNAPTLHREGKTNSSLTGKAALHDISSENTSDDMMDNSLIEYLEEHNFTQTKTNAKTKTNTASIEKEIVDVEERFSQNFKVCENTSRNEEKMQDFMERTKLAVRRKGMERLVIIDIQVSNANTKEKTLMCKNDRDDYVPIIVRAPWVYLDYKEGDVVHVIEGDNTDDKRLFSDERDAKTGKINDNLLILNPDILISATSVGGSVECLRRAILNTKLACPTEASIVILIGNIVHELLQNCLQYKVDHSEVTDQYIRENLESIVDAYSIDIIMCNSSKELVVDRVLTDHASNIKVFVEKNVKNDTDNASVTVSGTRTRQVVSFSNIIDIEENIWSPMYGVKGFIDVTVEAKLNQNQKYLAPLELKTGKTKSISHEAQGSIYALLLKDRYEIPVDMFFLFYTKLNDFVKHNILLTSLKHLIMLRNRMTTYLRNHLREIRELSPCETMLPPILASSSCDNCYSLNECMTLNKLCDDGTSEKSGLPKGTYDKITGHLTSNAKRYKEFYSKYDDLISKEESSLNGMNKEIFLIDSKTRESLSGKCLSGLMIAELKEDISNKTFAFTFTRSSESPATPLMTNSQLSKNDMIIVSDEVGHYALCTGRVLDISSSSVTISTKRRLDAHNLKVKGFDRNERQVLRSLLTSDKSTLPGTSNEKTYRIDRNEVQQGLALARYNVLNLFLPPIDEDVLKASNAENPIKRSLGGDLKTRELVVDDKCPKFVPLNEKPLIPYDTNLASEFNEDQIRAIDKVFRAENYALILGMPGTGKTTVIAKIIKEIVSHNKTVLLASYTHSAVDNILIKLKGSGIDIIRLGSHHKVHPEVKEFLVNFDGVERYENLKDLVQKPSVMATTCLGVHDILLTFRKRDFDYVILDEASQVSLPIALGPLRFGAKFILVGDHYQLPPLVKNDAAKATGLEVSLFKMLCDKHPETVVELTYQYRMCGDIMKLSNYLIYNDKLKCGTEEVRNQKLEVPHIAELSKYKSASCSQEWLKDVMQSEKRVIFLDHDGCDGIREISDKDNIRNPGEAELVRQCVAAMTECGIPREAIGVMTMYRAQLRLVKKMFDTDEHKDLEVLTADQFQGRDKQCVIISMVRSNKELNGGSLLRELRRVNVAMTRAKSKLIIIGSKTTIASVDELRDFMAMMDRQNWIYTLTQDCLHCYDIPSFPNSQRRQRAATNEPVFNKNITVTSKFVRDKPVIRDTLNSM